MNRLTKTLLATVSASALAIGMATPAMAENDVRFYYENDNDYTTEFNFSVHKPPTLGPPIYPDTEGVIAPLMNTGGQCTVTEGSEFERLVRVVDGVRVNAGVHEYLCWAVIPTAFTSRNAHSFLAVMVGDTTVTTGAGNTYNIQGEPTLFGIHNRVAGNVEVLDQPFTGYEIPEWLGYRFEKADGGDGYNLTMEMKWEPPAEQEAQLMSLMDVTPDDCTIVGTPGDDVLTGTDGDDVICGMGGDDTIYAGGGDDIVKGGSGDDTIYGGDGDDTLGGGSGDDRVDGGNGDDAMHGATGEDILVGGDGNDLTDGGSGDDALLPDDGDTAEQSSDVNDLAANDSTGNIVEDGNGDGVTAQDFGASVDDEEFRRWVEQCTFGPYGNC